MIEGYWKFCSTKKLSKLNFSSRNFVVLHDRQSATSTFSDLLNWKPKACVVDPTGQGSKTFWGCNCSFWSLNYVLVLLLTSFWRSFLFLCRVLLSTVQGQAAPQNITTNQNFLFWSLHSLESNCYQNKRYSDSKGALQRDPCSKRALLEEGVIYLAIVFKVLQSCDAGIACQKDVTKFFIKRTVFLSRSVVRTRSQRCKQHL